MREDAFSILYILNNVLQYRSTNISARYIYINSSTKLVRKLHDKIRTKSVQKAAPSTGHTITRSWRLPVPRQGLLANGDLHDSPGSLRTVYNCTYMTSVHTDPLAGSHTTWTHCMDACLYVVGKSRYLPSPGGQKILPPIELHEVGSEKSTCTKLVRKNRLALPNEVIVEQHNNYEFLRCSTD